jgi:hypothetical protein
MMPFNNCPQTTCRPRFRFGRASGFFGRWIRCQRPFQAVAGHDFVRATSEPAAVFWAEVLLVMKSWMRKI